MEKKYAIGTKKKRKKLVIITALVNECRGQANQPGQRHKPKEKWRLSSINTKSNEFTYKLQQFVLHLLPATCHWLAEVVFFAFFSFLNSRSLLCFRSARRKSWAKCWAETHNSSFYIYAICDAIFHQFAHEASKVLRISAITYIFCSFVLFLLGFYFFFIFSVK